MKLVIYFLCLLSTLFFTPACTPRLENISNPSQISASLPTPPLSKPNSQNLEQIIPYSYNLLVEKRIEPPRLSYDTADFTKIQFPNGDQGVFVTIGIWGIARGYQLLYRIKNEQFELIEPIRKGRYVWGLKSARNQKHVAAQVEFLDLFAQRNQEWKDILKVTGVGHAGSGLWDDGYFEILAITNDGAKELFTGVEFVTNSSTVDTYREYQFKDLDGDSNQEIIEDVKNCEYRISKDTWKREDLGCQQSQTIYKFDGNRYMPE